MRTIIVILALAVSGCAPKLAFSNEAGGVISRKGSTQQGYELAEAHCAQFGKRARITGSDILYSTTRFECV